MRLLAKERTDCVSCDSERVKDFFEWTEFISIPTGVVQQSLNVYLCEGCGFIFLNPQPSAELLKHHYSNNYKKLIEGDNLRYREQQAEFISFYIKTRGKAFDLGCFDGTLLHYLKKAGWSVSGCDFNEMALEVASTRYGVQTQKGGIDDVNLEDESQNLLSLVHVLEHMKDPNDFFLWSRRKLVSGGHIYIVVPDAERMFSNSVYGFFSFSHLNYFTITTLGNYLKKHGFDIVSARTQDDFEFIELLARKIDLPKDIELDSDYESVNDTLNNYAKKWQQGLDDFRDYFMEHKRKWVKDRSRVLLWGGGLHTNIILSCLPLVDDALELIGIVDKNEEIHGDEICGLMVYSPEDFDALKLDVVMVSSYCNAEEIGRELEGRMGFKGEIFYFYGHPTTGHPIARDY